MVSVESMAESQGCEKERRKEFVEDFHEAATRTRRREIPSRLARGSFAQAVMRASMVYEPSLLGTTSKLLSRHRIQGTQSGQAYFFFFFFVAFFLAGFFFAAAFLAGFFFVAFFLDFLPHFPQDIWFFLLLRFSRVSG
jgi:hypothetical protein